MSREAVNRFVSCLEQRWQQDFCAELLRDIRAVRPPLDEAIKWHNPYFSGRAAVLKWYCAKDWINVYFYRGSELDDPDGVFAPSNSRRLRALRYSAGQGHPRSVFVPLLEQAVRLDAEAVRRGRARHR